MRRTIAPIIFIFIATTLAWFTLGNTISYRTAAPAEGLRDEVSSSWGSPHSQMPPTATYERVVTSIERQKVDGKLTETTVEKTVVGTLPVESSAIGVDLALEHRQKGLLWFSTYKVRFRGTYTFRNETKEDQLVKFSMPYSATKATYDNVSLVVDGVPTPNLAAEGSIRGTKSMAPGEVATIVVAYGSQGLDRWTYDFNGQPAQAKNFSLDMTTDFNAIDFPENSLSPTDRQQTAQGWKLGWKYTALLTSYAIAMEMPAKLQPGPLAGEISYFAPVSLLFFFFVVLIITTIRNIKLHPMHYFFLATGFFSFHLLFAYLVDHISIHVAFVICSLVSIFLVVSYLRLVVNIRFALVEAAGAHFRGEYTAEEFGQAVRRVLWKSKKTG